MNDNYDVIVIGAGPAGLGLTSQLASSNLKILLLDKKNNAEDVQYNTSGSYINPKEYDLPMSAFNLITKAFFCSKNKQVSIKCHGFVIDKKQLLNNLEEKSKKNKNLEIVYNACIDGVDMNDERVRSLTYIKGNKPRNVSAKIFVDCSGVGKVLSLDAGVVPEKSTIGLGIEYLVPLKKESETSLLFVGKAFRGGYGWVFPKNQKVAIVGYCTLMEKHFEDIEDFLKNMWKLDMVSDRCELKLLERNVATLNTGPPLENFTKNNLIAIGDVVRQANPLVGEGVRFVLDSARIASKYIQKSIQSDDLKILSGYSSEWKKKYHKKYKLSYLIQDKLKNFTANDKKSDFLVEFIEKVGDKEFARFLSGDITYLFLAKMFLKGFWKVLI